MYEDIREKAIAELEEKRKRRRGVQVVGITFAMAAIILMIIASRFSGDTAFWIKFPIIVLALTFGIVYTAEYGLPFFGEQDDLSDEEIEREMVNIYRKSNLDKLTNNSADPKLELKEIEELKERFEGDRDFV